MTTARTGFPASDSATTRSIATATSSAAAVTVGTKSTMSASRCGSPSMRGERLPVRVGRCAAQHVDGIREARLGREERGELPACLLRQLRKLEPDSVADVRAQDPEPTGVGQDADASAPGLGLARKQSPDVDQLLERRRANHTGLVEERVHGSFGAGERGRVRARGALPGQGRPALQGENRLASRHAPRQPAESTRVAERLEIEQHDVCARIVLPPLE